MRWWMWLVGLLLAVGFGISLWHGRPEAPGQAIVAALEKDKGPARGAIMVLDYVPAPPAAPDAEGLKRGSDAGAEALTLEYEQHWVRAKDMEFVWRRTVGIKPEDHPLRGPLQSAARPDMTRALARAGYFQVAAATIVTKAAAELQAMNDEDLLLAWLHADRAVMAQADDPVRAAREGMLLTARQNSGPAIVFNVGPKHVYLLPMDGEAPPTGSPQVWAQMEAYEDGALVWTGVLNMQAGTSPERVRQMAARMAEEASTLRPIFR